MIERAKGILMERHEVDERRAFDRLRDHARSRNRTVVDVAASVVEGRALLPKARDPAAPAQDQAAPGHHPAAPAPNSAGRRD
jgi:hypothetical protein